MTHKLNPQTTLVDRIAEHKRRLEAEAAKATHGPTRDSLLKTLRHLDVAAHLNEWLSSPGLRPPTLEQVR
jgi:hypothetical protein